jgi:hypothetical protein
MVYCMFMYADIRRTLFFSQRDKNLLTYRLLTYSTVPIKVTYLTVNEPPVFTPVSGLRIAKQYNNKRDQI